MKELFIKGYTEVCSQVPEFTGLSYVIFVCVGIIGLLLFVGFIFRHLFMGYEG